MRNYKLSYFLSAVLLLGAFIAQYYEMTKPKVFRNDTMPWVLFCGGIIMCIVGFGEYNYNKKENK
jgi:hypothetical protein